MPKDASGNGDVRERLLDAGGKSFRTGGYGGAGIDGLAKAAGLTSGAFYANFGSKADAFESVIAAGFEPLLAGVRAFQEKHGRSWVGPFVDFYLGERQEAELCDACVLPTLSIDVARARESTRDVYQEALARVAAAIAEGYRGDRADERAWQLLSILAGASLLARAVQDPAARRAIVDAARASAKAV